METKIPYNQDKYELIFLELSKSTTLTIEQKDNCIVIEDIFEFIGKLFQLIDRHKFNTIMGFMDKLIKKKE